MEVEVNEKGRLSAENVVHVDDAWDGPTKPEELTMSSAGIPRAAG